MTEKMIRDAYCRIRTIDQTIPDEVLDFMRDASIEKLNQALRIPVVVGQSEQLPDANKHQCDCSNAKDRLNCGFECYNK